MPHWNLVQKITRASPTGPLHPPGRAADTGLRKSDSVPPPRPGNTLAPPRPPGRSDRRSIDKTQTSIDRNARNTAAGAQREVRLAPSSMYPSRGVSINPKPGKYTLRVRAIDGQDRIEGPNPTGIFPDGATGQQALDVTVA